MSSFLSILSFQKPCRGSEQRMPSWQVQMDQDSPGAALQAEMIPRPIIPELLEEILTDLSSLSGDFYKSCFKMSQEPNSLMFLLYW